MKSLYLIRHAKSDWNLPAAGDHERTLAKRGVRAAKLMGRFLSAIDQEPCAVLTSSAVRARTTVEIMIETGGWTCPVRVTRAFYESHPEAVLHEIATVSDEHERLLVAGHEPTWSDLVSKLCGGRVKMVTAGLARIDFEVRSWAEVELGYGLLVWFVPPKLLLATGWAPD